MQLPRRSLTPRRALTVGLALAAVVGVSGCGATGMNSAARSASTVVSEDDLAIATEQAQQVGLDVTASDALAHLVREPVLAPIIAEQGLGVSDDSLRQQIEAAGVGDPSQQLIDLVRGQLIWNQVLQADPATLGPEDAELVSTIQTQFQERIAAEDVEVNPRFGTWDAATGTLSQEQPAWIAEQGTGEDGAVDPLLPPGTDLPGDE